MFLCAFSWKTYPSEHGQAPQSPTQSQDTKTLMKTPRTKPRKSQNKWKKQEPVGEKPKYPHAPQYPRAPHGLTPPPHRGRAGMKPMHSSELLSTTPTPSAYLSVPIWTSSATIPSTRRETICHRQVNGDAPKNPCATSLHSASFHNLHPPSAFICNHAICFLSATAACRGESHA